MAGEAEYGFWHLLVRDVCYAQIPRAARAARHRAAAAWLERQAGERAEDLADVLAYHYLSALELARAAGQAEEAEELEANAIRYLALAGERALALDVDARRGRAWPRRSRSPPPATPSAPSLLERWAQAAQQQGRLQETRAALEEALALYRRAGRERRRRAGADRARGRARATGRPARRRRRSREALGAARGAAARPRARRRLRASWRARASSAAPIREAIAAAERALALAAELGLPEPARALGYPRRGPRLPGGTAGARGHAPGARARARAGPGPRRRRPAQQPRGRRLAVRGAAGGARCLPGGDRLLRAARHHRVRARRSPP